MSQSTGTSGTSERDGPAAESVPPCPNTPPQTATTTTAHCTHTVYPALGSPRVASPLGTGNDEDMKHPLDVALNGDGSSSVSDAAPLATDTDCAAKQNVEAAGPGSGVDKARPGPVNEDVESTVPAFFCDTTETVSVWSQKAPTDPVSSQETEDSSESSGDAAPHREDHAPSTGRASAAAEGGPTPLLKASVSLPSGAVDHATAAAQAHQTREPIASSDNTCSDWTFQCLSQDLDDLPREACHVPGGHTLSSSSLSLPNVAGRMTTTAPVLADPETPEFLRVQLRKTGRLASKEFSKSPQRTNSDFLEEGMLASDGCIKPSLAKSF